jgi:DNA-binding transcriptional LysR family regulator
LSEGLRDIRLFVAAYEERSFTAAAKREFATQSGISQHIKKLENRFGVQLFSRNKRRVTPTPAADSYYNKCVDLLRLYENTHQSMVSMKNSITGEIAIGLMPTMTSVSLAPAMRRFIESYPNVLIRVVEAYSPILTENVLSGKLDFAIVPAIPGRPGLKSERFLTSFEMLVSRATADNKSTHLQPVQLAELDPIKLVLPSLANTRRVTIETSIATNGVRVDRLLEMDAMMGTVNFIAHSDWSTILPALMLLADTAPIELIARPIVKPRINLDLVLIEPSRHVISAPARVFLSFLREESEKIMARWEDRLAHVRF